jgi:hypothetical protein
MAAQYRPGHPPTRRCPTRITRGRARSEPQSQSANAQQASPTVMSGTPGRAAAPDRAGANLAALSLSRAGSTDRHRVHRWCSALIALAYGLAADPARATRALNTSVELCRDHSVSRPGSRDFLAGWVALAHRVAYPQTRIRAFRRGCLPTPATGLSRAVQHAQPRSPLGVGRGGDRPGRWWVDLLDTKARSASPSRGARLAKACATGARQCAHPGEGRLGGLPSLVRPHTVLDQRSAAGRPWRAWSMQVWRSRRGFERREGQRRPNNQ